MKRGVLIAILCVMVLVPVLCGALFLTLGCGEKQVTKTETQQDVVTDIISRLIKQGIPIKSANVTSDVPFDIEVVVQSASTGDGTLPDDPLYEHSIRRELSLGKRYNLDIQTITITLINTEGKTLYQGGVLVDRNVGDFIPSKLDENTISDLRDVIEKNVGQLALSKLESSYDYYGMPWVMIDLQVKDIEEANGLLREFMQNLRSEIEAINMQKAQIAVYVVKVNTSGGELIFQYVNDLQLHGESWWQADGLDTIVGSRPPSTPLVIENTPAGDSR